MQPYLVETKVRWSDLDANMHMANASYMNFTSFARIEYLRHFGISLSDLRKWNIGPAILREEFSFFKEAHEGQEIMISVEQTGISEQGEIFEFVHNLYAKKDGTHLASARLIGVWFSMTERKIKQPQPELLEKLKLAIDPNHCRTLSMVDLKELPVKPKNIDPNLFV